MMATVQFKDYYQTLGVERTADEKAIRGAYRKQARQHHPDINPGDKNAETRFKEVNEAYEVLSNQDKRKMYDRYGEEWQRYRDAGFTGREPAGRSSSSGADFSSWFSGQQAPRGDAGDWTVFESSANQGDTQGFSDFFQVLFGNRARGRGESVRPRPMRGQDLEVGVEVGFDEAFKGATRQLKLDAPQTCATCDGTGLARGVTCPTCDGTGVVSRTKTLEVRIPAGVATGSRVRIAGQGGPGRAGGAAGDVYLRVMVKPDDHFERVGDDLRTSVEVPLDIAVLGGEVVATTPTGKVALTIPAGTQADRLFRLRGQGMPRLRGNGARGDLLAQVHLVIPRELTDRERELFTGLRDLRKEDA
jgi:DnaJ-class molecular chaperone